MDELKARLNKLAERVPRVIDKLQTEEATKNALVMPFIQALGYDVFDPDEVIPEYTADVGIKKGEKVDYAILRNGEFVLLFEAKKTSVNLSETEFSQLFRYFSVTKARIAVLTNGVEYHFFSDLEEPNKMDRLPFLKLDLRDLRDQHVKEVQKLSKEAFDLDNALSAANDLKYLSALEPIVERQFEEPDEEFVKFFFSLVNPSSRFVQSAREQFTPIVKRALNQYVSEKVADRIRGAFEAENVVPRTPRAEPAQEVRPDADVAADAEEEEVDDGIETTEEELEAYHIVKAIVRKVIDPARVVHRDTKSYMGVLVDDNNRKPICRFRFNSSQNYLGVFDTEKNEEKHAITDLNEIYAYEEQLLRMAEHWS